MDVFVCFSYLVGKVFMVLFVCDSWFVKLLFSGGFVVIIVMFWFGCYCLNVGMM